MPESNDQKVFDPLSSMWTGFSLFLIIMAVAWMIENAGVENLPYSRFIELANTRQLQTILVDKQEITGTFKDGGKTKRFKTVRIEDPNLLLRLAGQPVSFEGVPAPGFLETNLPWIIFALVVFTSAAGMWSGKKDQFASRLLPIEKNHARVYKESNISVTFADAAGVDEAKAELEEIIGFLREPQKYSRLGGRMPKGILLVGPPGTGKTLLARAVAGEAKVPFFSISGSEFVEMFVGVGAARVRDLFAQAQKSAPAIIFIDELDALGRARGVYSASGGHDEKEQTLNQLLVEMDGFDPRQGVILLAATNRPEILDAALLRAGRFDKQILVDRPDKRGREQILKVHLRSVKSAVAVNLEQIAGATAGFTGADLANLVNEATMLATRRGADAVEYGDFFNALERIVAGLEKKNRLLNPKERRTVAYHESGHAIVSLSYPDADPVQKVSIIPRGIGALGYTIQRPTEDRFLMSLPELEAKLTILLAGRAAEKIVFGQISTGATDDLYKATEIARAMVSTYGMSETLGPISYTNQPSSQFQSISAEMGATYSEETAKEIDFAVKSLINKALQTAEEIVRSKRKSLDVIATELLRKETLTATELQALLEKRDDNGFQPCETTSETKPMCTI